MYITHINRENTERLGMDFTFEEASFHAIEDFVMSDVVFVSLSLENIQYFSCSSI